MASNAIKKKKKQMINEYRETKRSFIEQSKDLDKYKNLMKSIDDDMLIYELELLEWQLRGCVLDLEESFEALKSIVLAEINKRGIEC